MTSDERQLSHNPPFAIRHPQWHVARLAILVGVALTGFLIASQDKPTAEKTIPVKLVTDFESGRPVSELEELQPVKTTVFGAEGSREITLGEKATLWVRNAHVDGKF